MQILLLFSCQHFRVLFLNNNCLAEFDKKQLACIALSSFLLVLIIETKVFLLICKDADSLRFVCEKLGGVYLIG